MARFRGTIKGQRGEVSRLGNERSGLYATVDGWNSGVIVNAYVHDGRDYFDIYTTGGSNGSHQTLVVSLIRHTAGFNEIVPAPAIRAQIRGRELTTGNPET